jgi:hypothetical protein
MHPQFEASRNRGAGGSVTLVSALFLGLLGCRENLSTPPTLSGLDTSGPVVTLHPAHDTMVDSTGSLLVRVNAADPSGVSVLDFHLIPATVLYDPLGGSDTTLAVQYPIVLGNFKHSTFRYFAISKDVLAHQTVTDTVTVTVR